MPNQKLPEDVRRQGITTKKQSTQILQFIALSSPDGQYDALFLSNYALNVKDEISRVAGVGEVTVFGAGDYSMRIWLDPQLLKQRGLTTEDVVNAIREQNVQVAAGQVGAPPAPEGTAFELTVNTQGRLVDPEQFEDIIVRTGEGGRVLRVGDVARVELGAKAYTFDSTFNGRPSTSLAVYQLPGANAMETAQGVREKIDELAAASSWPQGLDHAIPFDTTRFRRGVDRRGLHDPGSGSRAGRHCDLHLSAGLAVDHRAGRGDPGLIDRHLRLHERHRLFHQHALAVRHRAGDWRRRG